jgi:hypothetical protein
LLTVPNALLTVPRRSVPSHARSVRCTFPSIAGSRPPSARREPSLEVLSPVDFGAHPPQELARAKVRLPLSGDRVFVTPGESQ